MDLLAEGEQKIIDKSELDEHIDKGWRYVDSVDERRAIVEKQPFQHPDKTKKPSVQNTYS
ncbi:hypothetical protein AKJ39_03240 [candidate division MSBL1 archaeon SCGC-AAA259J03]|uniref:Uncharacterized protein n=1 Tax=candidate division MSBL1 archaeon SCGC-AAA259J03 TaxID=1698269 RepID=A0A656YYN1_9EURY|nr:hypothetical protein AKJ39_03240 [candidate division MSBL1 archaeon SCGC-AAA259J03]